MPRRNGNKYHRRKGLNELRKKYNTDAVVRSSEKNLFHQT